jgi:hypothetical protein
MNISKFDMASLEVVNSISILTPQIDIRNMVQKSRNVQCGGNSLRDIRGKGKELSSSLGSKNDRHYTHEKFDNRIFSGFQQADSIPKQEGINEQGSCLTEPIILH